jgi:hypothetical protein
MDDGDLDRQDSGPVTDPVRGRFERAISIAAPLLDLVLAVGDRISRVAEPVDYEYYPVRSEPERDHLSAAGKGEGDRSR